MEVIYAVALAISLLVLLNSIQHARREKARADKYQIAHSVVMREAAAIIDYCDYDFPEAGWVAKRLLGLSHIYTSNDEVPQLTCRYDWSAAAFGDTGHFRDKMRWIYKKGKRK